MHQRTLGLIGGCGAVSTLLYYQALNSGVESKSSGHSASLLLRSFNIAEIKAFIDQDRWDIVKTKLVEASEWLVSGGAEAVLICSNTLHLIADEIAQPLHVPLINIIDVTAEKLINDNCSRPLVLGTKYSIESCSYLDRLKAHLLNPIKPKDRDIETIHEIIYQELIKGIVTENSKNEIKNILTSYQDADSIVLGCTELDILFPDDSVHQIYSTTNIHIRAGLKFMLGKSPQDFDVGSELRAYSNFLSAKQSAPIYGQTV